MRSRTLAVPAALAIVAFVTVRFATAASFGGATVRFEQNATDGDFEVVVEVDSGEEGLAQLTVKGPDGRQVIESASPGSLGLRQFQFESPEPPDREALVAAFPEGEYSFLGTTVSGRVLRGVAKLHHALPPPASGLHPADGASDVPTRGLVISWNAVEGASAYLLEVENDRGGRLNTTLPAGATRFALPDGFLVADTEYQLGIGTVSAVGNVTVVEVTFHTTGNEGGDR